MSSILIVSSINNGEYRTAIEGQKNGLNENDFQTIEKALPSSSIKRDGTRILSKDLITNVIQSIESAGDYFDEYNDPETHKHQLTPTNINQGKTPQLRQ